MSKLSVILLILAALFLGLIGLALYNLEWERVEKEIGLNEEANQQPLLAATTFLADYGVILSTVKEESDFLINHELTLNDDSTFIIDEAALLEYPHFESAVLSWIEKGGHVIYLVSPKRGTLPINENVLLTQTGVSVVDAEHVESATFILEEAKMNVQHKALEWHIPHSFYFENCSGKAFNLIESENTVICDMSLGNGFITFIPSIHPISNHSLRNLDHGEFLFWLVGDNHNIVYLPSIRAVSWLSVLWQFSWLFVVLSLFTIVSLMWHISIRLGLPYTPNSSFNSAFSQHIEAVGSFLIRQNQHAELKKALMKDLEQAIELRSPRYHQLPINEQVALISALTGKNEHVIEQLLTQELPEEDEARLQFVKTFKELRNAI